MDSESTVTTLRETKYTVAVRTAMTRLGHATNAELAQAVRLLYPDVSDTTIHRVTHRLAQNGELGLAPNAEDGAVRYDANTSPHDHFQCRHCYSLRDMQVPQACRALIQHQLNGCKVGGALTVTGTCAHCLDC